MAYNRFDEMGPFGFQHDVLIQVHTRDSQADAAYRSNEEFEGIQRRISSNDGPGGL